MNAEDRKAIVLDVQKLDSSQKRYEQAHLDLAARRLRRIRELVDLGVGPRELARLLDISPSRGHELITKAKELSA